MVHGWNIERGYRIGRWKTENSSIIRILPQRLAFDEPRPTEGPQRQGLQPEHGFDRGNGCLSEKSAVQRDTRDARQHDHPAGLVDAVPDFFLGCHRNTLLGLDKQVQ